MSQCAYPAYRPSGVEWLGDVPEGWLVERLKFSVTSKVSNVDKLSGQDEIPVRLCNYVDVYKHEEITPELSFMEGTATAEEISKFALKVGDVVITKDSEDWRDIAVPAYVRETAEDLVCGYHLAIVRVSGRRMIPRFLFDLFRSRSVNTQFQVASSGVTRYGLPKSAVGEAWVPIPPKAEQKKISAFIEIQTQRIDELIRKKRELIERLKEKRTALISHVVTKGLPPEEAAKHGLLLNPPLKPSGVPWLGDIPEHWDALDLKYIATVNDDDWPEATAPDTELIYVDIGSVEGTAGIRDKEELIFENAPSRARRKVRDGDVIVSTVRTYLRAIAPIRDPEPNLTVSTGFAVVRPRKIHPNYLAQALTTQYFVESVVSISTGVSYPATNPGDLMQLILPVPPENEQIAIAKFLVAECAVIDHLVALERSLIERLQEYRSALITAAVTGKIDVRQDVTA